jgi:hypothetical protein
MSKKQEDEFPIPEFHRDQDLDENGVSQVIIERFVKYRLPILLRIREEMDEGKVLSDGELELLNRVVQRAHQINKFVHLYPDNKELVAKVVSLFGEITSKALENESRIER